MEYPPSLQEAVKILSVIPRPLSERRLLASLAQSVGNDRLCLTMLRLALNASSLTIPDFVNEARGKLSTAKLKYARENEDEQIILCCIEMGVQALDEELRSLLSGLWIWHKYFWPELLTAVLLPDYEYTNEEPSPVDEKLRELQDFGFIIPKPWWVSLIRADLYYVPQHIKYYCERYLEPGISRSKLLEQFGSACAAAAEAVAEDVAVMEEIQLLARCSCGNLLRGVDYTKASVHANYLLHCARIAFAVGDTTLSDELVQRGTQAASEANWKIDTNAAHTAFMGFYYDGFRPVFIKKAVTPQEQFNEAVLPAAESLCDLGIFRKVFLMRYEPLIRMPSFVDGAPIKGVRKSTYITELDQAEELCRSALRALRRIGDMPTVGLFAFGLACVYAQNGKAKQARTQFENVKRATYETWDIELQGAFRHESARLYASLHDLDTARSEMEKSISYFEDSGNFYRLSATFVALGVLAHLGGRSPKFAALHFKKAIDALQESALSHNAYGQSVEDMDALLKRLSS